ncbi:MAG: hypothetical protein ACRD4R_06855 [Candidatus Acidiferrales bacterium]
MTATETNSAIRVLGRPSAVELTPDWSHFARRVIEFAGGRYLGPQASLLAGQTLHLFQDPATRTTLAILDEEITIARVVERLERARAAFAGEKSAA